MACPSGKFQPDLVGFLVLAISVAVKLNMTEFNFNTTAFTWFDVGANFKCQ